MTEPTREQAIAARLTAIAERLKDEIDVRVMCALQSGHGVANVELLQRAALALRDLSAHVETLTQQVAELYAELQEKYQACPPDKLSAAGRLQYDRAERAEQENARLTAAHGPTIQEAQAQMASLADHYGHGWLSGREALERRLDEAEQQRDAAHAALRKIADEHCTCTGYYKCNGCVDRCANIADAALAASAPQKE